MLRALHNHIFTLRLKEVFDSPLVLVYQTLGHVDHHHVKQQLAAGLAQQLPAQGGASGSAAVGSDSSSVTVDICQMKNTMAAATCDDTMARLFTNSNLLVGFRLPQQQQQQQQQLPSQPQDDPRQQQQPQDVQALFSAATAKIARDTSPQAIVGGMLQQPMRGPHIPQQQLRACVEAGGRLAEQQPLVLIGAFYKRAATPLVHLRKWIKLDQNEVYGTLLGALESPMMELFAMEGSAEELLACLEDTGGPDVAGLLDYKAAVDGSQQGADGGGAAAAPRPA